MEGSKNPMLQEDRARSKYPFHVAMECGASDEMLALLLAGTADTPPLGFASCLHWACEMRKELDFCRKVLQAVPRSSSAKTTVFSQRDLNLKAGQKTANNFVWSFSTAKCAANMVS